MNTEAESCQHLSEFVKVQMDVMKKHLDEHQYLRKIIDKNDAMESFVNDYGWLIRELYCTQICQIHEQCIIASKLKKDGDLLRHKKTSQ